MKLHIGFALECGDTIQENKEYKWNTDNLRDNQIAQAQYESFINFNKPGNMLFCEKHDYSRIKRISISVVEFDT